ncbi:MAG: HD domain-containing protein [Ferruginibacter sp.]
MQNKQQMQQFVIDMLQEHLPVNYCYHNCEHSLYVQEVALQIGRYEKVTEKEMALLSAAALWHDTGYIETYAGHEEESCSLAKKYLPEFGFTTNEINLICGMIMATRVPQSPKTKLEEIIADADLAYLGTSHAAEKATDLFYELQSLNPSLTEAAWDKTQVSFLESHHYFTPYCKEKMEPVKQAYLAQLNV